MSVEATNHYDSYRLINVLRGSTALTKVGATAAASASFRTATARRSVAVPSVLAAFLLVSAGGAGPALAETLDGVGQTGFDTLIPVATAPGANDTVNITIGPNPGPPGTVVISSNLVLPARRTESS